MFKSHMWSAGLGIIKSAFPVVDFLTYHKLARLCGNVFIPMALKCIKLQCTINE